MIKLLARIHATCFGIGYFPLAPGTVASFGVVLLYKFFLYRLDWPFFFAIFILFFFTGVLSSTLFSSELKKKDPRYAVIDEAAGQYLALFQLDPSWFMVLLSFGLFRFFDIVKPFPIRKAESLPEGWGIMLDDLLAALYTGILIHLYLLLR
jgi:phosphatidylglycerophosphatase A